MLHDTIGLNNDQFDTECLNLASLRHHNILQLVGYCHETRREYVRYKGKFVHAQQIKRALCLEYMYNGSLETFLSGMMMLHFTCISSKGKESFLKLAFDENLHSVVADKLKGNDWSTRYAIIKGICNGLKYLHEELDPPMSHLDLKLANILLNENMVPKITDFGLSRFFDGKKTQTTKSIIGTR